MFFIKIMNFVIKKLTILLIGDGCSEILLENIHEYTKLFIYSYTHTKK